MPTVYVDSLTIENFGPFYGETEFQFSNLDGRCGILIGGKNGAGKTHLLRALYLAVVGETGQHDLKKLDGEQGATSFVLQKALNRRAQAEGKDRINLSVTLSQRDENDGGLRKLILKHEIRCRPNAPVTWRSTAEKSGTGTIIDEDEKIKKLRDGFLPRHLSRFFFFDAERSQSFDLGEKEIVEGVSRILGLYSYERLEGDLRLLVQDKYKPRGTDVHETNNKLADLNGQISKNETLLASRADELVSVETELRDTESELRSVEDEMDRTGTVDPENLRQSQTRHGEITVAKTQIQEQLGAVWEQAMPLALLGNFRQEFYKDLQREEKRRDWESSRAAVEPKIPQIKEDVFSGVTNEYSLSDESLAFYIARLETALQRLFHPPPEGMSAGAPFLTSRNDISAQVRALVASNPASIVDLDARCRKLETLDIELRELDARLRQMQSNRFSLERGQELSEQRGALKTSRDTLQKQRENFAVEIAAIEKQLTELRGQETLLNDKRAKMQEGQDIATLASRYRDAASRIREMAAVQLREQISQGVGELWTQIVERGREFSGLEFDQNWRCFLVRQDGERVAWEDTNTSAGQRQVRMLAFYETLRREARLKPPLVVDTPLGRLDKEVRASVLERLYSR